MIPTIDKTKAAELVFEAIHVALQATDKTREPMNALIIWTELGKGFAGRLERQGADRGLLGRLVVDYCHVDGDAAPIDLGRWAYRLEPDRRLDKDEAAAALARAQRAIEERLVRGWGDTGEDEGRKDYFMAAVRGWFPVGLDIMRSLPAFRGGSEADLRAALGAWCKRYLPDDGLGPSDLGVRIDKRAH